jgi:hypothetical protein
VIALVSTFFLREVPLVGSRVPSGLSEGPVPDELDEVAPERAKATA